MKNLINWGPSLSVQVKIIDEQHKKFIGLINKTYSVSINEGGKKQLEEVLNSLIEYIRVHFSTEEKYFEEFDYEGKVEHIKEHEKLMLKVIKFKDRFEDGEDVVMDLLEFLKGWLEKHLKVMDKKYVKCFNEHGLK